MPRSSCANGAPPRSAPVSSGQPRFAALYVARGRARNEALSLCFKREGACTLNMLDLGLRMFNKALLGAVRKDRLGGERVPVGTQGDDDFKQM